MSFHHSTDCRIFPRCFLLPTQAASEPLADNFTLQLSAYSTPQTKIVIHPDTPLKETKSWIQANFSGKELAKMLDRLKRLSLDARPVRLTLLKSPSGNRCVVFRERGKQGELTGLPPAFDYPGAAWWVMAHEAFHCIDPVHEQFVTSGYLPGDERHLHQLETRADVFAAIEHLRQGGDVALLTHMRQIRISGWAKGDFLHDCSPALGALIAVAPKLRQLPEQSVMSLLEEHSNILSVSNWLPYRRQSIQFSRKFMATNKIPPDATASSEKFIYSPRFSDSDLPHSKAEEQQAWLQVRGRQVVWPEL